MILPAKKPTGSFLPNVTFLAAIHEIFSQGLGSDCVSKAQSAILGKLGTALQAYTLDPCNKFPPNQINQTPALWQKKIEVDLIVLKLMSHVVAGGD